MDHRWVVLGAGGIILFATISFLVSQYTATPSITACTIDGFSCAGFESAGEVSELVLRNDLGSSIGVRTTRLSSNFAGCTYLADPNVSIEPGSTFTSALMCGGIAYGTTNATLEVSYIDADGTDRSVAGNLTFER